jgi:N-acetylmuramoyl-L-alanine amidase
MRESLRRTRRKLAAYCSLALVASVAAADPADEHPAVEGKSAEFRQGLNDSVRIMHESHFEDLLEGKGLGSRTKDEVQQGLKAVRSLGKIDDIDYADLSVTYDVILQPGHYGRTSGSGRPLGTQGNLVSEKSLVAYITARLADQLRDQHLKVLVVSADDYPHAQHAGGEYKGLRANAFLAIHADGSKTPCNGHPSLAYEKGTNPFGMHVIAYAISTGLGYKFRDFLENFTVNEEKYYMWSQVQSSSMKGLLEVGELTCPSSEENLLGSVDAIATDLAAGLMFVSNRDVKGTSHATAP